MKRAGLLVASILAAGCAFLPSPDRVESLVERFHSELNRQQYARIYAASDGTLFRRGTSEARFVRLVATVHRKLGNVQRVTLVDARTTVNMSGTFVALRYTTRFQRGVAAETLSDVGSDERGGCDYGPDGREDANMVARRKHARDVEHDDPYLILPWISRRGTKTLNAGDNENKGEPPDAELQQVRGQGCLRTLERFEQRV